MEIDSMLQSLSMNERSTASAIILSRQPHSLTIGLSGYIHSDLARGWIRGMISPAVIGRNRHDPERAGRATGARGGGRGCGVRGASYRCRPRTRQTPPRHAGYGVDGDGGGMTKRFLRDQWEAAHP